MDLLDRLLGHDAWTTRSILEICVTLADDALDRDFDIGHSSLRATLHHIIYNMEVWSCLMAGCEVVTQPDRTISSMMRRLSVAEERLKSTARAIANDDAWDTVWTDYLDEPPREKSFGTGIAHIITHSMHHRAQLLYMLRRTGIDPLPEGDVFSWEASLKA